MRKRFDLQTLKLNTRISELELQLNEILLHKREGETNMNASVNMTTSKLLRHTTEKERSNQVNEAEKRKLQELIDAKDKEINELNEKIKMMRDNFAKEIAQKNAQLEILKKNNEDL